MSELGENTVRQGPPPEVLEKARALVKRFYSNCFWFRHPEARVETEADVRLVISHLREHGGHLEWREAQDLVKCL